LKKHRIKLLVSVISITLFLLITLQFYWINSAIDLRRQEFNHDVSAALKRVVTVLEKIDAVSKLKSHKHGRFLFLKDDDSLDSEYGTESSLNPDFSYLREFERKDNGLYVTEKKVNKDGEVEEHIRSIDEGDIKDIEHLDPEIRAELAKEKDFKYVTPELPREIDSATLGKVSSGKRVMVSDIVRSLTEFNINEKLTERLTVELLDSVLAQSFEMVGISLPFEFAVTGQDGSVQLVGYSNESEWRQSRHYRSRLYPDDLVLETTMLEVVFPDQRLFIFRNVWFMLVSSILIILVLIYLSFFSVSTIIRQKEVSEIKNDFINNMTHELKTPISTISLACEALKDKDLNSIEEIRNRYINVISMENKRLWNQVELVLQSAVWDKGDFRLKLEQINIHEKIENAASKISMQIQEKSGSLEMDLQAKNPLIVADKMHLINVIYNLLDNSIKYSYDQPKVKISTRDDDKGVYISVSDNGIGISKENQEKVFEKLYRVPTGNVHNVKGYGLGLNYVKSVVEKHHGEVSLKSQLKKGSTFTIFIPNDLKITMDK